MSECRQLVAENKMNKKYDAELFDVPVFFGNCFNQLRGATQKFNHSVGVASEVLCLHNLMDVPEVL